MRIAWVSVALLLIESSAASASAEALHESAAVGPALISAEADAQDIRLLIRRGLDENAYGDLDAADRTWQALRERHPGHPAGWVFALDTLGWRKALDFTQTGYDAEIERTAKQGLELSRAWLEARPHDRDALFYAGQSLIALAKLNGMRGKLYRAGTQGEEARKLLERALEIDPEFHDAKYALGSYFYYASIATRFIKWLTWLWFVPTGERDTGLVYVSESASKGNLTRFEAAAALARIYLYMEFEPDEAAPFIDALLAAHPSNSYLQFELVELRMIQNDYPGTIEAARALEATTGDSFGDAERRNAARIWRARSELGLGLVEEASTTLTALEADLDGVSRWGQRWILLTRAQIQDLAGDRRNAVENYERVIERQTRWGSTRPTEAARSGLESPYRLQAVSAGPAR